MMNYIFTFIALLSSMILFSQNTVVIKGKVTDDKNAPLTMVNIVISGSDKGSFTDFDGNFQLELSDEAIELRFSAVGFRNKTLSLHPEDYKNQLLEIVLIPDNLGLDQVVITGTRDRVEKKKAPVIVNSIRPQLFSAVNSVTMSEGLNYTPGVRLETNCQNCNTTQVRMNGLDGSYSQILINGLPVFSALNGVYGLEQIPTNMVDRIEVVRGGGSALYGAGAVGGTINIITREPVLNSWDVDMSMGLLEGKTPDRVVKFHTAVVSDDLDSGISIYGMYRNRDAHDYDGDGFTEVTKLDDNILGLNAFLRPDNHSRIGFDFMGINSYRRGGDRLHLPPHETAITEELDHKTVMGGLTYNLNVENTEYSVYLSGQFTKRKDYYGGMGDPDPVDPDEMEQAVEDALKAYGYAPNLNTVSGGKIKHRFNDNNQFTFGVEHAYEDVDYQVPGYNKITKQYVRNYAAYGQYEWKPEKRFTALLGARLDHVNVNGFYQIETDQRSADVAITAVSPRISLMYDFDEAFRVRAGYGRGFRPPRAYDEDFEVGSADEKLTFILISEDLKTEYSDAFTLSFNFDKIFDKLQTNFLVEGFYTRIERPFTGVETGETEGGFMIEEIRNALDDAYVAGVNFDFGVSPSSHFTAQIGGTWQLAKYKAAQVLNDPENPDIPIVSTKEMLRTPDFYGYLSLFTEPFENWNLDLTGTYTGPMDVAHILNEDDDFMVIKHTRDFFDLNAKLSRKININEQFNLTLYGGIQNIFDAYQQDFDQGAGRDSDYVYGPATPRTYFFGLKIGNL